MQQPIVDLLVWMRVPGDVLFSIGALLLAWFVLRLWVSPRKARTVLPEGARTTQN
jgi:nitric oxide reductase subunit B